jgi:hypothetical protein
MYRINKSLGIENGVIRLSDNAFIPLTPPTPTTKNTYAGWILATRLNPQIIPHKEKHHEQYIFQQSTGRAYWLW